MSFNENSYERQPGGQPVCVCAPIVQGIAVVFHSNIWDGQLEHIFYSGCEQGLTFV